MNTEYIRILNCNYERLPLEQVVEELRYQYCILGRGGIKYLLPCSLRIMDEKYYLYYDISSKQNVSQTFGEKRITRDWMLHFLSEVVAVKAELERYLLEDSCITWNPRHIYQDLERDDFFFMYVPYTEGHGDAEVLMEFFLANIDYGDDELITFTYQAYDRLQSLGLEYLGNAMYQDFLKLTEKEKPQVPAPERFMEQEQTETIREAGKTEEKGVLTEGKKKRFFFWESRRRRREDHAMFRQDLLGQMRGYAVCEDTSYGSAQPEKQESFEEEFGKTIYIEEMPLEKDRGLYQENGELLVRLSHFPFVVGKKRDNVNLVLSDYSVSRVHARIVEIGGEHYLEDLNSTNGTYKNGLRLQPYEKRKLEEHDEVRFGKLEYTYR